MSGKSRIKKINTLPAKAMAPYQRGARFLVIPADLKGDFSVCKATVDELESNGAWLVATEDSPPFPRQEEVFLIEFQTKSVLTHRSRILRRQEPRIWVDCPSLTKSSKSKLVPMAGRQDFRVPADLQVVIVLKDSEFAQAMPRGGRLSDLSRGGMGLIVPVEDIYAKGQLIEVQVVSWAYPVAVETTVERIWIEGQIKHLALKFPVNMSLEQRERVSSFILHVQRQESLHSLLPAAIEDSPPS